MPPFKTDDDVSEPISAQAMKGFKIGLTYKDEDLLHRTSMAAMRRLILLRLKACADKCMDVPENRFQARQRLAGVAQIGRDIDRLATAAVIMLRESTQ